MFKNATQQRHIQNQVKHLGWSFLRKHLTDFGKYSILDVWLDSECSSARDKIVIDFSKNITMLKIPQSNPKNLKHLRKLEIKSKQICLHIKMQQYEKHLVKPKANGLNLARDTQFF